MRYGKRQNIVRAATEQDFGRAFRYISFISEYIFIINLFFTRYEAEDGPPLASVLVSEVLDNEISSTRVTRSKNGNMSTQASGIFKLPPDYRVKMYSKKSSISDSGQVDEGGRKPDNEDDLRPYMRGWYAGKTHQDFENLHPHFVEKS